jgi:aryl-alcohol dehydrogenase-like predicted oxidoreductase
VATLLHRPLGSSGIEVSALALGSWKTYERIPREQAVAVMTVARERGIDFLDDARYDDSTGTAPLRTGYSEVLFGDLFRAVGWKRDEVVVSNKLWWEFWPRESAAGELDGSLGRMRFDYVDLIYATPPPAGLEIAQVVGEVGGLIAAGKARAWAAAMWSASQISEAVQISRDRGVPPPCAVQTAYNVVERNPVEDDDFVETLDATGVAIVASAPLAYGALTAKYRVAGAPGRIAGELDNPAHQAGLEAAEPLAALASELGTTPAALALAFSLSNPRVASVLFGATRPEQVTANVEAAGVLSRLDDAELASLRGIGARTAFGGDRG